MTRLPPDRIELESRLQDLTGRRYSVRSIQPADSGIANTTWLLGADPEDLVIKVLSVPSVVYQQDVALEPQILGVLADSAVPVPAVRAVDSEGLVFGSPWFAMTRIVGRSLPDHPTMSYMSDGWFAEAEPTLRRQVWNGFVDCLAQLHTLPAELFDGVMRGGTHEQVLNYFAASLEDLVGLSDVRRQERAIAWLRTHAASDVDEQPALCMADARMANLLEREGNVVALLDWELAYVGNPCGDIGYHLYLDGVYSTTAGRRLDGLPDKESTWARWERSTGRTVENRHYWEVFGALIISVTATRAIKLAVASGSLAAAACDEERNPFALDLERMTDG